MAKKQVDEDISKLDLYAILNVQFDAVEKEILRSYRKQALKCHPDKNPDNPKAAEQFHLLSRALEVLTDEAARAAYDKVVKARKATELRRNQLDSKRKKLREDLEEREKAAESTRAAEISVAKNLQAEIERLRKEGSALLEQEQERLKQEVAAQKTDDTSETYDNNAKLKVKWKAKKDDPSNGGYSKSSLIELFSKYGDVNALILSKRNGSAIVEFANPHEALMAVENAVGISSNPVTLTWLSGEEAAMKVPAKTSSKPSGGDDFEAMVLNRLLKAEGQKNSGSPINVEEEEEEVPVPTPPTPNVPQASGRDFESLVMRKMRQAEERKRLIEQLAEEDG